jgi:DNA-binding HxlR family transcriptional regulator
MGLYRRRWARSALSALAEGPRRQADLKVELVSRSGRLVHHRTFISAMSYLESNSLIQRHDHLPGRVVYEIAELGRQLHAHLESLEQAVQDHHTNNNGRAIAPVPDGGVDHGQAGRPSSSHLPPVT